MSIRTYNLKHVLIDMTWKSLRLILYLYISNSYKVLRFGGLENVKGAKK